MAYLLRLFQKISQYVDWLIIFFFLRMTRFRDKSALFGGRKGPDDEPTWGDKEYKWKFSEQYAKQNN